MSYLTYWTWLFTPSVVPQFVYDLNHPWINENKVWLEGRETALEDLCNLNSPLRSGGIEGHVYPANLFSRLEIDNNRYGIERHGWKNALNRLKEFKNCPAALNDVNHLHTDIYINDAKLGVTNPFDPGYEIPLLFAEVLTAMPNLRRLDWGLPTQSTPFFEKVFVQRNLSLPSVTHLVPGAFSHYIVPMCPNLERLEAGSYENHESWVHHYGFDENDPAHLLLKDARLVPSITHLSYKGTDKWDSHLAYKVIQAMPNLVELKINGDLKPLHELGQEENPGYQLKAILRELQSCTNLTRLTLPRASGLDLGFDGGSWCGNAYNGVEGRAYGRQVEKENTKMIEIAGDMVISILPHLEYFKVGSYPEIRRGDDGIVTLVWPWTGRPMEEWLYKVWPEPEKKASENEDDVE